jgi:riboflavin biosynthesis pyrimidine reductase
MYVIWYTAMSMDGRIASAGDSLDFLDIIGTSEPSNGTDDPARNADVDAHDFEVFLKSVDAVIVGASTLRWLLRGGHGWPHGDLPTWLVTHDEDLAAAAGPTAQPVHMVSGSLETAFTEMAAAGHNRVWLAGGGNVAGQALALDRVDEVVVTIAPTALVAGPALFDGEHLPLRRFRLVECRAAGDAAQVRWLRDRS